MKLTTPVEFPKAAVEISYGDRIMVLGSCFADNVGKRLKDRGFELCLNPFGTLYNPSSIERSIARLDSGEHFVSSAYVQTTCRVSASCLHTTSDTCTAAHASNVRQSERTDKKARRFMTRSFSV